MTPVSSTKTSRPGSIGSTSLRNSRRFSLDLGRVPLGGVRGLLLQRQAELLQGPADDHDAAGDAQLLPERLERGVGGLLDELSEPLQGVVGRGWGRRRRHGAWARTSRSGVGVGAIAVMVETLTENRAASFLREPSRLSTASRMRSRRSFDRGFMSHLLSKTGPSNRVPSGCDPL